MKDATDQDQPIVEAVAKAIYGVAVGRARERAANHSLQIDRLRRVFTASHQESDRSVAILIFALAEDLMLEGLKRNLNPKVRGGWKAMTNANGLLATASDRITMLELLYWIREDVGNDLRLLKSIRNRFAHNADVASFADKTISGWVSSLKDWERPVYALYTDEVRSGIPKFTPRELFMIRACSTVGQLSSDLAIGPAATSERVSPADVEGESFDDLPDNIKDARRVVAEVMLAFFPPLRARPGLA